MADADFAIANLALLKIGQTKDFIGDLNDPGDVAPVCKMLYAQKRDEMLRDFAWPWAQRRAYLVQLGGATWAATTTYAKGAYVSYAPSPTNVVNPPESLSTFVYMCLPDAGITGNAANATPDTAPTQWRQISRAEWAYCFLLPGDVLDIHGLYHGNRNPRSDQQVPYALGYEPAPGPGRILLTDSGFPWEAGQSATPVSVELMYTAQVVDVKQFPPDFVDALAWSMAVELALSLRKDAAEAERCAKAFQASFMNAVANAKQEIRSDPDPAPSWISARRTTSRRFR